MIKNHIYSISQASTQTGLPRYLIRMWESRYSAVVPLRSGGNRRIFSADDIQRLRLLSKAVDIGHSISQIATLSQKELKDIVDINYREIGHRLKDIDSDPLGPEFYYRKSLQMVAELNVSGLQVLIDEAAVNLTRPAVILDVVVPLYSGTKRLVQSGKLRLINLNVVTSILQGFLWNLLKTTMISESAPKIVVGTPSDHLSEIGALALALIAVESGFRSLYFGSNLPAKDIAAAVKLKDAQAVALFTEDLTAQNGVKSQIKKLQDKLDDDVAILVCTNQNSNADGLLNSDGISVTTLKNFRKILEIQIRAKIERQFVDMEECRNEMVT